MPAAATDRKGVGDSPCSPPLPLAPSGDRPVSLRVAFLFPSRVGEPQVSSPSIARSSGEYRATCNHTPCQLLAPGRTMPVVRAKVRATPGPPAAQSACCRAPLLLSCNATHTRVTGVARRPERPQQPFYRENTLCKQLGCRVDSYLAMRHLATAAKAAPPRRAHGAVPRP
jgi:hypothetical protein